MLGLTTFGLSPLGLDDESGGSTSAVLVTAANSDQVDEASSGSVSQSTTTFVTVSDSQVVNAASSSSITSSAPSGTITISAIRSWPGGTLRASESGITVWINDADTGALVAKLTGQATDTGGNMTITHSGMVIGTMYSIRREHSDGAYFTRTYTAA